MATISLCSSSLNPGFPIFQIGMMLVHFTGKVVVSIKLEFPWRVLGIACDFYEVLSKKSLAGTTSLMTVTSHHIE